MRHAYLIMAHNNFEILKCLLKLLDYKENDIYLHIDLKVKDYPSDELLGSISLSKLEIFQEVAVLWGDYSIVETQLLLMKKAAKENYDYYHFLSGADLPIKKMSFILGFFEKWKGKEFVHFVDNKVNEKEIIERVKYYQYFHRLRFESKNKYIKVLGRILYRGNLKIEKMLGINRMEKGVEYRYGSNWSSLSKDFVSYVLSKEDWISKTFRKTNCPDELYIQTLLYNSKFVNHLFYKGYDDNYKANGRYIVFETENNAYHPHVWTDTDRETLAQSELLFARKFDEKIDMEIVEYIYDQLTETIDKETIDKETIDKETTVNRNDN